MNNFNKKILNTVWLLIILISVRTNAQQTIQIYQEDFNSGGANFLLNSGGPSSNSGPNKWVINNSFIGNGS